MNDYITVKDVAKQWGITPKRVQVLCANGQIPGAVKFGRDWAIPKGAEKPQDGRSSKNRHAKE